LKESGRQNNRRGNIASGRLALSASFAVVSIQAAPREKTLEKPEIGVASRELSSRNDSEYNGNHGLFWAKLLTFSAMPPKAEIAFVDRTMSKSRRIPHVLLLVETSVAYGRGVVEGIGQYALEHGPWSVQFQLRGVDSLPPTWLKNWRGDGIISRTISLKAAKMLKATRLPLVEMLGSDEIGAAQVRGDFDAMAAMAADHFLTNGLRQFAYFTYGLVPYIEDHLAAFQRIAEQRAYPLHLYGAPAIKEVVPQWDERQRSKVARWLRSLPRPIGIFTPGDSHALQLLDICRELNIAVPEEMAILGVGNDPVICETLRPTLSSIDLDAKRIGYEAARLLDRKMAGQRASDIVCIPPSHVVVRQSTDVTAIDDADVVEAMRFIRDFACTGISVSRVAEEAGVSLSTLKRKFRELVGRSPKAEIMRVQIEFAKRLLAQTDRNCESVAKKAGFHSLVYFTRAFRRETGTPPNAFRRKCKLSE
jgi:LacI family transcriptional regulator